MDRPPPPPAAPREGRGLGWRAGMALLAALCGGAAWALWRWPWLLSWAVAAGLGAAALLALASALLARGPRRRGP